MKNITSEKLFKLVKKGPQSDFCEQCPRESVNLRADNGDTLLMVALRKQRHDIVTYLLDCGADVTPQNQAGNTALHIVASVGDVELCRRLQKAGARVNACNTSGMTPLMQAAMLGHPHVVECLLGQGAEVNAADAFGRTASLLALLRGHAQVVTLLEKHGSFLSPEVKDKVCRYMAEHNIPERDFSQPFTQVVREANTELMRLYFELGMHFSEEEGENLVSLALALDNPISLDMLLSNGCHLPDVEGAFLHGVCFRFADA